MKKYIYLGLAVLGIVLPYTQFVPWTNAHGFNLKLIGQLMFANQIASGIAIDALLAAATIFVFIIFDSRQVKVKNLWLPIIGIFTFGISFALPMYLYFRTKAEEIINN